MKFTVRQLLRTPVRQILFVVLMALCAAAFSVGYGLYSKNVRELEEMDNHFVTMGTFEQLPEGTEWVSAPFYVSELAYEQGDIYMMGDAALANEYEWEIYGEPVTLEDIAGLPYKIPAENRPVYYAGVNRGRDGSVWNMNGDAISITAFTRLRRIRILPWSRVVRFTSGATRCSAGRMARGAW